MTTIQESHFVQGLTDALQYISYYHSPDFIAALSEAWQREQSPAAKDALAQILTNSRLCALGHRPICQDTGVVNVFLKVGMGVRWQTGSSLQDMVDSAVARAYSLPENPLRASMVTDPAGSRKNTGNNTPAIVHSELVPGDKLEVYVAAKGGGSENKARLAMLNPSDDIVEWVLETIPTLGAGWCPPGVIGIGIGGTAEKAMLMAKESLLAPVDIHLLRDKTDLSTTESLRLTLFDRINALGIGAQGLGGLTTVLDVKVLDFPTHATSKPVALIPNCAATRHVHFTLDGSGPPQLPVPDLNNWPEVNWAPAPSTRHVDLDTVTEQDVRSWQPGETLLLSGRLLTGRDAAHQRIVDLLQQGKPLPDGLDFHNRFIYYVGPVDAVDDEAVGPAGPTTATRMDKFTDTMLERAGILGMIGKAERGPDTVASLKRHGRVYLIATGGAAYLISRSIRESRVVAFPDLGMEAVHEFVVRDMPVTVAVDSRGTSVHESGPLRWRLVPG